MKNFHIIFKSIEGKIKAGVDVNGTLVFFKEEKDEKEIKRLVWAEFFDNPENAKDGIELESEWQPELDKPYKIEGVEIEIRFDQPYKGQWVDKNQEVYFAFLKQPKDVFDTGARLPEQKEDGQIWWDWKEVIAISDNCDTLFDAITKLKSKFTLTRKP